METDFCTFAEPEENEVRLLSIPLLLKRSNSDESLQQSIDWPRRYSMWIFHRWLSDVTVRDWRSRTRRTIGHLRWSVSRRNRRRMSRDESNSRCLRLRRESERRMNLHRSVTVSSGQNPIQWGAFVSMLWTCRLDSFREIRRSVYDIDEGHRCSRRIVSRPARDREMRRYGGGCRRWGEGDLLEFYSRAKHSPSRSIPTEGDNPNWSHRSGHLSWSTLRNGDIL